MKKAFLFAAMSLLLNVIQAQNLIFRTIEKNPLESYQLVELFTDFGTLDPVTQQQLPLLTRASTFTINESVRHQLLAQPTAPMRTFLPFPDGEVRQIILIPAQNLSNDFSVFNQDRIPYELREEDAHHYWGIIEGEQQSAVALSIFPNQVTGMMVTPGQAYNLTLLPGDDRQRHLFFTTTDLQVDLSFECGVDTDNLSTEPSSSLTTTTSSPENCVRMYVEVDYNIFVSKGGLANTVEYITGLFNQVTLMYFNEAIKINLHELVVWETEDPYTGPSLLSFLNQFRNNVGTNFNGDLAHLVGNVGNGGVASLDVLCSNANDRHGYSGIPNFYFPVPVYSGAVNVMTHEIGHNLGSPHTHDCVWNGNNTAIDRCGIEAGYGNNTSCNASAPVPASGTVMSYCHLLIPDSNVDLALGFGPQPGDRIRNRVYNAGCLVPCEPSPEICDDNFDNDFDGLTDCEDPDCDGAVACLPCEQNILYLYLTFDNYSQQNYWEITDENGEVVDQGNNYQEPAGSTIQIELCLDEACYTFTIFDANNNGMCCASGEGGYVLTTADGEELASGSDFGFRESFNLCDGIIPEYCNDGIDNDFDGLVDCDDPDCDGNSACLPCYENLITLEINYDAWPLHTSWRIEDDQSMVVATGRGTNNSFANHTGYYQYCLPAGCYDFIILDEQGNGICCSNGPGSYTLTTILGELLATGGEFGDQEVVSFCISDTECPSGPTFTVTTTQDSVAGSLRQAILCANALEAIDSIVFDLPNDTLWLTNGLPPISNDHLVIDGAESTVINFTGSGYLFDIQSNDVAINNFTLLKQGAEIGNAITTLPTTENYEFSGNRIDGFRTIFSLTGKNGLIRNNTINVAELGSALHFLYSSEQHIVEGNIMSSTSSEKGIILVGRNHQIRNNTFSDLSFGIRSANADTILIEGNTFYNNQLGIVIYGTSEQNRISQNSMYCNEAYQGIRLYADANNNKLPPVLTELTATTLTGTSLPGDTIEIYLSDNSSCDFDAPCQGKDYLGTTVADTDGNWIYDNLELTGNEQLTALATDANNNSSSFADCMLYCAVVELSFEASATTICAGDRLVLRLTSDAYYEPDFDIGYFYNNVPTPLLGFSLSDSVVLYLEVTTTFTLAGVNFTTECEVTVNTTPYVVTVLEASALSEQIDLQLCAGESIEINGEMVSIPGVYNDTLTSVYGCDSLLEINLSVLPPYNTTATLFLCEGETTELFGNTVYEAGVYEETYVSVTGCDSLHQVSVEILPNVYTAVSTQICDGESVDIFGSMVSEAGVYEAIFTGSNGCDSTHQITLEVLPSVTVETSLQICNGQSIELFGETVSTAGTYTGSFMANNGCDSTHTVQVSVVEVITAVEEHILCPGGSILVAGEEISESGTYEFMFTSTEGCDSLLQVIVEDATIPMTESAVSICAGESILLFGEEVAQAGSYTGTLTSSQGCDSIHTVQLSVLEPIETSSTLQACTGQSIELFGEIYTTDAVASATFTSENGCDSTHQVTLTFTEIISTTETMEICAGSEIMLFGETVSTAGIYTGSFVTADGCDSIHQVTLTVAEVISTAETMEICAGSEIMLFGETVSTAGIYTGSLVTADGCDSIHQVTVTVAEVISTAETMEICAGSEIMLFGETVSTAGIYTGSFVTADGCDSVHQVTVQVVESVTNSASVVICEGETALIFGEEQSNADVYTATFMGQNGCDSTQIIELEVLAPGFSESALQICAGESVLLFGEPQSTAGTYEAHFTGANGCDSTAFVQLTVLETPQTEVQTTASCANESNGAIAISTTDNDLTFTWTHTASDSNNLSDLSPGLYYLTVTNSNNCTKELELEILALPLPDYEMTVTPISCSSLNSGMIQLMSNDSDLEVSINNSAFTSQLEYPDLPAGDYALEIRTTEGCSQTELVTLEPAINLTLASLEIIQPSCPGQADGSIFLEITGGNDGLQFLWQTGQVGSSLENVEAGTYSVTVTNAGGCQWEDSFELTDLAPIDANLQLQLGCGDGYAFAIANPSAGQAPYELNWSTNQTGTIIANLTAGSYSVSLTDANGCTVVETFDIPYIAPFQIEEIVQDASCADSQDGSIELLISGGIPPYQINWNNGTTESTLSELGVGTYNYNASSGSCGLSATVNIGAPATLEAQVAFDLDAQNNLQAIALASGGTSPYSYQWSNGATGMMTTNLSLGQTITLTLTDANGCVFTQEFLVSLTSTDQVMANQFRIFPNPTSGQVFIEHALGGAIKYQLEIYHPAGAGLISQEEVTTPRHELSLKQLPAGVYLIVLSNEHFRRIERVVLVE